MRGALVPFALGVLVFVLALAFVETVQALVDLPEWATTNWTAECEAAGGVWLRDGVCLDPDAVIDLPGDALEERT